MQTTSEPRFWDYVKAAFVARRRVPGLGGLPLNVLGLLALGVAGLVNPGFWLLGAGLEVGYLSWLSQNARFRSLVRGEQLRATAETFAERLETTTARLSAESRARFKAFERKCGLLRESDPGIGSSSIDEVQESGLNSLLLIHSRLLLSRDLLHSYLSEADRRELERKLADAETRLRSAGTDAMRRALEGNAEILRKRLARREEATHNLEVVEAELERLENQLELLREESAVSRDPGILSSRIDAVASTLSDANQFLQSNAMLLGDLSLDEPPAAESPRERARAAPERGRR